MEETKSLHLLCEMGTKVLKTVPFSMVLSMWTFEGPLPPNVDIRGHLTNPLPLSMWLLNAPQVHGIL